MPSDSEALRARLRLMGNMFMFLKLKFPQKGVLATCSKEVFDNYVEFLFGDQVWGFTTKGDGGRPSSCPHQGIVEGYDYSLRERVAKLMSEGTDIEAAFDKACEDKDLRHSAFLCYFTTESASARCRALTAPAFKDIHGASGPAAPKRGLSDADSSGAPISKAAKKKAAKKQTAANQKAIQDGIAKALKNGPPAPHGAQRPPKGGGKKVLALQNGGVGDGSTGKKGAGKGKSKTPGDNKPICFAHNDGTACKQTPCPFEHVCSLCLGTDHGRHNCPNK